MHSYFAFVCGTLTAQLRRINKSFFLFHSAFLHSDNFMHIDCSLEAAILVFLVTVALRVVANEKHFNDIPH